MSNYFDIIIKLIEFKEQLKINHWQVKSYAQHKAFDDTYDSLNGQLDTLVEAISGKYGRFVIGDNNTIKLINIDENSIVDSINKLQEYLVIIFPNFFVSKDTEIFNIRDEILQTLDKLKYLLTLF